LLHYKALHSNLLSLSLLFFTDLSHRNHTNLTTSHASYITVLQYTWSLQITRKIVTGLLRTHFHYTLLHFTHLDLNWKLSLNWKLLTRSFRFTLSDLLQLRTFHSRLLPRTTRELASVSPINFWSDTRETLLPTVLLLLRHCWNPWCHCWRGQVTPPHSCVIQVFIAVAWQRETCLPRRCVATVAGWHSRRGRHRFPLLLRNCRVYRGAAWVNPLQYKRWAMQPTAGVRTWWWPKGQNDVLHN
jgi:hypothetical protein